MRCVTHLGLRTKCLLLVLPLVAVSLLLLANTTSSYWTLQACLADFRADTRQAKLAGEFAVAVTRQVMETIDIAFVAGEKEDELENAQRAARETLSSWIQFVSRRDDPRARHELDELAQVKGLYLATQLVMQETIDLGQRGDRESALEVVEEKLDPLANGNLLVKTDALLHAAGDELANSVHEAMGAMGQMRFVGNDTTDYLEEIEADYRQTVLASHLLISLNRHMAQYAEIVLAGKQTDQLKFAEWEAEQTLRDWRAMAVGKGAEGELRTLAAIENQYAQLGSLAKEVLRLVEQGNPDDAWERLENEIEPLVDRSLIPRVAKLLSAEQNELTEGIDGLAEHAASATSIVVVVAFLIVLLGIATPWLLERKIVKPIVCLTEATENIGAGNLQRRVEIASDDEIGRLTATFNGMADRLQESHEELEQRVRDRTAELQGALKAAQAATTAKSEFLANMSHEIRTPMTAILGFAENLLGSGLSESEKLDCIRTIRRNGESLLEIINDILDLSKIEAGKMGAEWITCEPCSVIAEVLSLVRIQADAKGLPLNIEYEGAIPRTIRTDPLHLRQILINLIGNAIKFTETGTVRLVIRFVDGSGAPCLQFDVIDTGRGMTEEQSATVFQPFMQADNSATRKIGGTGLGLTISKRFAEMLGGDITVVQTKMGRGSTFRATVATGPLDGVAMLDAPLSATLPVDTANAVARVPRSGLQGCRILLAEDGPDNQRLICFVLKKAGAEVTVKENGKLALDSALAASDEGKPFDAILMDMQMPLMDGYEAAGLLRQNGYTGPIIALTAHAMSTDRDKCLQAGCNDYMTKPIDRKKLISMLAAYASRQELQPSRSGQDN